MSDLLDRLRALYKRCELFPENNPDGMSALLDIRNLVPDIIAAVERLQPAQTPPPLKEGWFNAELVLPTESRIPGVNAPHFVTGMSVAAPTVHADPPAQTPDRPTLSFTCPHCGDPAARTLEQEVDIHSGATYTCLLCNESVVFTAHTPDAYVADAMRKHLRAQEGKA